jgi:ribonuclease HI
VPAAFSGISGCTKKDDPDMAAKKFYAILAGRAPGIYDNWPKAQAQVAGFQGARFKGFATRAEAEAWLKNPTSGQGVLPRGKIRETAGPDAGADTSPREGVVFIYTDGGARYNPGPGGYGIVQVYNGQRKELSGGFRLTTNNRMELMGCIVALRELEHRDRPVALFSDSSYVVNGISKGWAKGWRKRGWIKADRQPAINPDLWAQLLDLVDGLEITFNWVRGHNGNPFNERCDELAVASARLPDLPVDPGYKG